MKPTPQKCTATTRRGMPCRRWATRDSDPPLCPTHDSHPREDEPGATAGFYLPALWPEELDRSVQQKDLTLDEEISLARVCLLRMAEALKANGNLTPEQRIRLAALIFRGASTVARLLRDRQAVSGEAGDSLSSVLNRAVDEATRELGVEP